MDTKRSRNSGRTRPARLDAWRIAAIAACAGLLSPSIAAATVTDRDIYNQNLQCVSVYHRLLENAPADPAYRAHYADYQALLKTMATALHRSGAQKANDIAVSNQKIGARMDHYMTLPRDEARDKLGQLVFDCDATLESIAAAMKARR